MAMKLFLEIFVHLKQGTKIKRNINSNFFIDFKLLKKIQFRPIQKYLCLLWEFLVNSSSRVEILLRQAIKSSRLTRTHILIVSLLILKVHADLRRCKILKRTKAMIEAKLFAVKLLIGRFYVAFEF